MAIFVGKQWFRDNIAPYLAVIKSSVTGYAPIVTSYTPIDFQINTVTTVTLTGEFFTPDMVVTCGTATITNVTFIGAHSATFDIDSATGQVNVCTVTTPAGSTTVNVESLTSNWIDLRSGSTSTWTETHDPGTTITYDVNGLNSSGTVWGNWYKFGSHTWLRSVPKRVSIIMKHSGAAHMAGIMSNEQDEASSAQYYQAEIYLYVTGANYWGFYGTTAAHTATSNSQGSTTVGALPYYKIVFENNGEVGSTYNVYALANLTDFDDTSVLSKTGTVGATMTADGTTLYVAATTSNSSRMVAFLIEDM